MKYLIVIGLVCFLQACEKPSITNPLENPSSSHATSSNDPVSKLIAGKWNWVKSEGGISYRVDNPTNTGSQLQLEFNNDGTVNYYKNNKLEYSSTYSLGTTTDPATGVILLTIYQNYFGIYPEAETDILHINSDDMTFDEPGADRFVHIYKRSKNSP